MFVTCSIPSASPTSSSSHSRQRSTFHDARTFFSSLGVLSVTKSAAEPATGRTLHLAPPLMRIFFPASDVRSYTVTRAPSFAAKYAAVRPAAPPPRTATSGGSFDADAIACLLLASVATSGRTRCAILPTENRTLDAPSLAAPTARVFSIAPMRGEDCTSQAGANREKLTSPSPRCRRYFAYSPKSTRTRN